MGKFEQIAEQVIKEVGGKENIFNVAHCNTRLRFNLKDDSIPSDEKLETIPGVFGVVQSGGQYQIIVGQEVDKIYQIITDKLGLAAGDPSITGGRKKITLKSIGSGILGALADSITPLLPVIMTISIFKMLAAVLGPTVLGVISEGSDLYTLFTFVGDAGFYFFPILIAYTAAKKFDTSPVIAMLLSCIMMHPTLVQMAADGKAFSVYGIPAIPENYSNTFIPVIIAVWIMSFVEKFFKKYLPAELRMVFVPSLTIAVMLPITLCAIGPAGFWVGESLTTSLLHLEGGKFAFLGVAIIAAFYELLVMTGMHIILITSLVAVFSANGFEGFVNPAAVIASLTVAGMCFGAFLRKRKTEEKMTYFSCFIAEIIGGVAEPGLYGICIPNKRPFLAMWIGGFFGGLYAGLTKVTTYTLIPNGSFLTLASFLGGPMSNAVNGFISVLISVVIAAFLTYKFGFKEESVQN